MNLDIWTTVLVAIVPAFTAMCTIIGAIIKIINLIKQLKKESNEELDKANAKMLKAYDNIAKINAKISSIEKHLLEKEKKWVKKD